MTIKNWSISSTSRLDVKVYFISLVTSEFNFPANNFRVRVEEARERQVVFPQGLTLTTSSLREAESDQHALVSNSVLRGLDPPS